MRACCWSPNSVSNLNDLDYFYQDDNSSSLIGDDTCNTYNTTETPESNNLSPASTMSPIGPVAGATASPLQQQQSLTLSRQASRNNLLSKLNVSSSGVERASRCVALDI